MKHTCHAHGCKVAVPPKMFMCLKHWRSLRPRTRKAILDEYVEGQEKTKDPTLRYLAVQQFAVAESAFRPNDEAAALASAGYMQKAIHWQGEAIASGDGDPLEGLVPGATL